MKRVACLLFLVAVLSAYAAAQDFSGDAEPFPEQIVFRSLYAGIFTTHTTMIFLYPIIYEQEMARYIYWYNSWLCHQRFDRSFFIGEHPLAVCARCTGINIGKVAGSVSFYIQGRQG